MSEYTPWRLSGTTLESCNCEAICPCRKIGGRPGGRSTYGLCLGALSWVIDEGQAGGLDLSGLGVVMAIRYHDDEPGSPWSFYLYLDDRGDDRQRDAIAQIFLGRLGGTPMKQFPWAFKASDLLGMRAVPMEIDHTRGRGWFRAGDRVSVRIREPVPDQETVTCVIPGHHQPGREVYAESLMVGDPPLEFEFEGRCGFESRFSYSSEG